MLNYSSHTLMVRLPNCSQAIISLNKIENYLLNFSHREGRSKAMFFSKFGYSLSNTREFYNALRDLAFKSKVVKIDERMPFGMRITTEGCLQTPDKRNLRIRVGSFVDVTDPGNIPRLITIIPVKST